MIDTSNIHGYNTPLATSLAQAQNSFAQAQASSADTLSNLTSIQDKDGKKTWMGIEMSPAIAQLLQSATSWLPSAVNDALSGGTYKHASELYDRLNTKFKFDIAADGQNNRIGAHKAGLRSAAAVSGLLIGIQPTVEAAHAFRKKSGARAEIRKNLQDIIETNKNYENNEVIKTAMERTHKVMVMGLKHAAGELPTVFTNGMFALGNHKQLVKETNKAISIGRNPATQAVGHEPEDGARPVRANGSTQQFLVFGATIGDAVLKEQIAKDNNAELSKPTAYELIMDLQKRFNDGHISKGDNISGEVTAIFHQNELDRGRSKIGDAFAAKFQPLMERVAEVISKGELEPLALVNLVGEGKIINKRKFISADKLEGVLDAERKALSTREKTALEDFKADLKDPETVMKAVKETLKTLKGDEKALFASILPDDVLVDSGLSKKEILQLRVQGHDSVVDYIKSAAVELSKKTPEELKIQGLSDKHIEAINNLNQLIVSGNEKEVKTETTGNVDVKAAVRTSMLNQIDGKPETGKPETPWVDSIRKATKHKPGVPGTNVDQLIASRQSDSSVVARV